ncbi:hypothetical protein Lepto7375DRAFT_0674 [Leptolyngbya sp. PCC 7375]|nr:hypothetical protein Lepto7375DRAFT_0674 [Leptolyngbya sp. PCC 7375]
MANAKIVAHKEMVLHFFVTQGKTAGGLMQSWSIVADIYYRIFSVVL